MHTSDKIVAKKHVCERNTPQASRVEQKTDDNNLKNKNTPL